MKNHVYYKKRFKYILAVCLMSVLLFSACSKDSEPEDTENAGQDTDTTAMDDSANTVDEDSSDDNESADADTNKNTDADSDDSTSSNNGTDSASEKAPSDMTHEEYVNRLESSLVAQDFYSTLDTATTTQDMQQALDGAVAFWDQELNKIYTLLMDKLSTKDQGTLREEEREWIKERDAKVAAARAKNEGGTMASIHGSNTLYNETRIRTYALIDMYYND